MKLCNKCNKRKPLDDFWADADKQDKKSSICISCRTATRKPWYAKERNCKQCQKLFRGPHRETLFCSRACSSLNRSNLKEKNCKNCDKSFWITAARERYREGFFCSRTCAQTFRKAGWSQKYIACMLCGTTQYPHASKGRCKSCYYKTPAHKMKEDSRLKHRYGITTKERDLLTLQQKNRCAICKEPLEGRQMHIDHDHFTKKIRGILCSTCNQGLGSFHDKIENLKAAVKYLSSNSQSS